MDDNLVGKEIVTEQPIHFSQKEIKDIQELIEKLENGEEPRNEDLEQLVDTTPHDIDIAMFGRMIAKRPDANVEAAVQVAHAISIHEVEIEDDFFTAVDDLNRHGSAHMGEQEFVSAIYYLYFCINNLSQVQGIKKSKDIVQ